MDLDNFIIGKTKKRRGERRFGKKKPTVPKRKERGELLGFLLQKKQKNQRGVGSVGALRVPKRKQAPWG